MKILSSIRLITTIVLSLGLSEVPSPAQHAVDQSVQAFYTESRQVVLDVVVSDHNGHFIGGLKPDDFAVFEDGKPQKIVAMTPYFQHPTPTKPSAPMKLPPNQYTNYEIADSSVPVTIVLMDVLNTQVQDQAYARKQMIEFLKNLPVGRRVALFALGTRLRMLQGFTGDSDTLVAAAKMLQQISSLMTSEPGRQDAEVNSLNLAMATRPGATDSSPLSAMTYGIEKALAEQQNYQQIQRMNLTIAALSALGRAVSAYPGHKNLLWLSAEFPIRFGPDFHLFEESGQISGRSGPPINYAGDLRAHTPPLHQLAAMLAASQVAVYPIDVRGNMTFGGNGVLNTSPTPMATEEALRNMHQRFSSRETVMKWDDEQAMTDIARETGGKAFFNTNDLKAALEQSTQAGENYYSIAYAPENHNWDGKYRKIEVKCAVGNAKLTYRRGYYAVPDRVASPDTTTAEDQMAQLFATAMHPEGPTSTTVLLKVQVLPPDENHKTVRIDYAINAHDVVFVNAPGNTKHVVLDLMAVAWDKDGKDAGHVSEKIESSVSVKAYEEVMRSYIPVHQELELQPGTYTLRLGVLDRTSKRMGTLDVPLSVGVISLGK